MIIDGRSLAKDILVEVKSLVSSKEQSPKLGVVTCAPGVETRQYLELKQKKAREVGVRTVILELPETASTDDCVACINRLAEDCQGIVVQLPLPEQVDREKVLDAVPVTKDPDGFSYGRDERSVLPPVAGAIQYIANKHQVSFAGKKVVVVGHGRLVGKPAVIFAEAEGGEVTILEEDTPQYEEELKTADIVITGVGKPHFIKSDMVKDGVIVFDAGASEDSGEVVGDVHPEVADKALLFTPVPGGIGPITVALLLKNLIALANR